MNTVQWNRGKPPEHDSIFARLKGTDKWNSAMFEKRSDDVLVTLEGHEKDGTAKRITIVAHTSDGEWRGLPISMPVKVIAWAEMPEPMENDTDVH